MPATKDNPTAALENQIKELDGRIEEKREDIRALQEERAADRSDMALRDEIKTAQRQLAALAEERAEIVRTVCRLQGGKVYMPPA